PAKERELEAAERRLDRIEKHVGVGAYSYENILEARKDVERIKAELVKLRDIPQNLPVKDRPLSYLDKGQVKRSNTMAAKAEEKLAQQRFVDKCGRLAEQGAEPGITGSHQFHNYPGTYSDLLAERALLNDIMKSR